MGFEVLYCLGFLLVGLLTSLPRMIGLRAARGRLNAAAYQQAYSRLAQATGMTYEPGLHATTPRVTGRYRERQATVALQVERLLPLWVHTSVTLRLRRPVPGRLTIRERGGWARLGLWLRRADLSAEAGQAAFRYEFRSEPAALAGRLLGAASLRRKLLAARGVSIECQDETARLTQPGILSEPEQVMFLLDLLSEVARLAELEQPEPAAEPA